MKASAILCLSYEFPPLGGGGSGVVCGLTRALVATGTRVDLVTMGYGDLPAIESKEGVQVRRIGRFRMRPHMCSAIEMIPYVIAATLHAVRTAKAKKYELNHTHFIFPDGVVAYLLKKATGLKYVLTAHGSDVPNYNPDRFALLHKLLRPVWLGITSQAECIVCPSRALQSLIEQANAKARVTLIPNGIDCRKFSPHVVKQDRILMVTRMFPRKGVQYLLRALAEVRTDFEVNIVGDGPFREPMQDLAREMAVAARFWGTLDNSSAQLKELYETSRIFVFPSEAENFPIVLLEAMTAGMAIITTDRTGCAEVVGDSALLVGAGDSAAIARSLRELIADDALCEYLGRRARHRAEELFDWPRVALQYQRVFDGVCGNPVE
ncbi:MAG: glycosyltransferase family 4 protein [Steroidobacteraceae bacterium]